MPSTTLNLGRVKGSMWYTGTADSNVDIASALTSAGYTPIKLDMYLNTSNGNVYQHAPVDDGLQWKLKGNLRGAKGEKGDKGDTGADALVYYGEAIRIMDPLSINQIMNLDKSKFNREPVFGEYFVAIIKFFESFDDYSSGIYKTYLGYYEVNNANGVDSDGETIIVFAVLRTFVETTGADGADGQGVPAGGTAGQILAKKTETDYDTEWIDAPSGGTIGNNILQADVNFTSMAAILDYALNLEKGKLYKLNWTFNGVSYSQTTYCWGANDNIQLGTMDSGGGGESILINPDNIGDGIMVVMDKMYANPSTEESYVSENNATILAATQNYANLIIQSIKEVGTYTPPIPIPTGADTNKILQVQGAKYTLSDLPTGIQSLYRHDVQIMSYDNSNRPAFAQCVILDYSSVTYNYDRLFSLLQKMLAITAVGTVVVERSDGKKTQGNVIGIEYNSSDGKIKIMSTYIDSDTSTSISQNSFEIPSNYQIYDYATKIE